MLLIVDFLGRDNVLEVAVGLMYISVRCDFCCTGLNHPQDCDFIHGHRQLSCIRYHFATDFSSTVHVTQESTGEVFSASKGTPWRLGIQYS